MEVNLTDDQYFLLNYISKNNGVSISELVNYCIDEVLLDICENKLNGEQLEQLSSSGFDVSKIIERLDEFDSWVMAERLFNNKG